MKPYLLEINKGPDMIPKNEKDILLKKKIYNDTISTSNLLNNFNNHSFKLIYKNII